MATTKDTASFFENGTTEQFEFCYNIYPKVLQLKAEKRCKKPQELIRLDQWYQNELPKLIRARGKDAHMIYDELVQTMKWKQSRGKFYPQLSYLVKVNTPRAVMQETKKAFRKLPNLEQAITALSNLKGVGTTMASALLAAAAPDSAPFMADECLMAIPEIEGIDYTTKEYLNFVQHIHNTMQRLNAQAGGETPFWSPHRVELALWAHYVANDLKPEMLDEMPGPGAGCGANTNGSTTVKIKGKEAIIRNDDTNDAADADDESLSAAGRMAETNNTATESETEMENTNTTPIANPVVVGVLQDGDSNFVSNDSTSQEPIIDENTTQTTATTSTDDNDVGTPLVSDSESNMEAPPPIKANATAAAMAAISTAAATAAPQANTVVSDTTAIVAPMLTPNNNSSSCRKNNSNKLTDAESAVLVGNGNGNGTLLAGAGGNGDSLDGENSNCLRSSVNEGASEYTDEEDRMADESSNSNSRSRSGHKSVTPIINMNDGTNTDNDSTLSSAGIGQKRASQCAGLDTAMDASTTQPEFKKIRTD